MESSGGLRVLRCIKHGLVDSSKQAWLCRRIAHCSLLNKETRFSHVEELLVIAGGEMDADGWPMDGRWGAHIR